MKGYYKIFRNYIHISIFFIIGLLIFSWYNGSGIIYFFDDSHLLNFEGDIYKFSTTWYSFSMFGKENSTGIPHSILYLIIHLINSITDSVSMSQRILYYILYVLAGLNMYIFARSIYGKYIGILAGMFYMLNLWVITYVFRTFYDSFFLYSLYPLSLYLFFSGLKNRSIGKMILFSLSSVLVIPAFANPAYILTFVIMPLFYSIYRAMTDKKWFPIVYAILSFTLFLLISWWWLFPELVHKDTILDQFQSGNNYVSISMFETTTKHSDILNLIRLRGEYPLYDIDRGGFYEWSKYYNESYIINILSFSIPLLIILSFFQLEKYDRKNTLFFIIVYAILIFFIKGKNYPFGSFNVFLIQNVPMPFASLRVPYEKLGVPFLISISCLISIGFINLHDILKRKCRYNGLRYTIILLLILIVYIVLPYPLWTGDVVPKKGDISSLIYVPEYYYNVSGWISNQDESRFLVLPLQAAGTVSSRWNDSSYVGMPLLIELTNKSVIFTDNGRSEQINYIKTLYDYLLTGKNNYFGKILGMMNVRYIMVLEDINLEYNKERNLKLYDTNPDYKIIENRLSLQNGISFKERIGNIAIYETNYTLPHIYPVKRLRTVYCSIDNPCDRNYINNSYMTVSGNPNIMVSNKTTYIRLISNGSYTYSSIWNKEPLMINITEFPYLLVTFRTNKMTALKVGIDTTTGGKYWLSAMNPPNKKYYTKHYSSEINYTLLYDLKNLNGYITYISLVSSNVPKIDYEGELLLVIDKVSLAGDVGNIEDYIEDIDFKKEVIVYQNFSYNETFSNTTPDIDFDMISPAKYLVKIKNSKEDYFLIFSEGYDKNWKIFDNNRQTPEDYHFIANGFANGWYINKTGDYTLILEYNPYRFYNLGIMISLVTLVVCVGYFIYDWRRKRNE